MNERWEVSERVLASGHIAFYLVLTPVYYGPYAKVAHWRPWGGWRLEGVRRRMQRKADRRNRRRIAAEKAIG